jgi:hypothetical protein
MEPTRFLLAKTQNGDYCLKMTQTNIKGHGGAIAPALIFSPRIVIELDSKTERQDYTAIQALGVNLYDVGMGSYPLFSSGLQYYDGNSSSFCRLPIQPSVLERFFKTSQIRITFDVWLSPKVLAEKQGNSGDRQIFRTDADIMNIDEAHWLKDILPQVGYPETRLVPLTLNLPSPMPTKKPDASVEWKKVIDGLGRCTDLLRSWHFEPTEMVKTLRPVVENTLFTWLTLWGLSMPSSGKADDALQSLNQAISRDNDPNAKPCNAPNGIIPVSVQHRRLCVNLTILHDLLQLSNVESHAKTQGTYTTAEAESLLYMVVGVVRVLPQLWEQYPTTP